MCNHPPRRGEEAALSSRSPASPPSNQHRSPVQGRLQAACAELGSGEHRDEAPGTPSAL